MGLERIANKVHGQKQYPLLPSEEELGHVCKFVHAVSQNALNSILTNLNLDDVVHESWTNSYHSNALQQWPCTLQMIMLDEQADMVGGLMDFNISICCCAFDGTHVKVTPPPAFSLITGVQVVTPFVLEEGQRNWKQILKYYCHGFDPSVVDPNCTNETQSWMYKTKGDDPPGLTPHHASRQYNNYYQDVMMHQNEHRTKLCCGCSQWGGDCYQYSFALFQKQGVDACYFFRHFNKWTDNFRQKVQTIHEYKQVACKDPF